MPARKRRPRAGGPDRWATLNVFADEQLKALTRKTGSGNAAVVWLVLFRNADGRTGLVRRVTVVELADRTGLAENTVRSAVKALLGAGLLRVHKPGLVPVYELAHVRRGGAGSPSTVEG
ncbi:MAG: hypothetical protein C0501_19800 [Isosphaera sp.]|nr:hypothetical protein [Isosphaera sp.]